jgi:hypothetical protein
MALDHLKDRKCTHQVDKYYPMFFLRMGHSKDKKAFFSAIRKK